MPHPPPQQGFPNAPAGSGGYRKGKKRKNKRNRNRNPPNTPRQPHQPGLPAPQSPAMAMPMGQPAMGMPMGPPQMGQQPFYPPPPMQGRPMGRPMPVQRMPVGPPRGPPGPHRGPPMVPQSPQTPNRLRPAGPGHFPPRQVARVGMDVQSHHRFRSGPQPPPHRSSAPPSPHTGPWQPPGPSPGSIRPALAVRDRGPPPPPRMTYARQQLPPPRAQLLVKRPTLTVAPAKPTTTQIPATRTSDEVLAIINKLQLEDVTAFNTQRIKARQTILMHKEKMKQVQEGIMLSDDGSTSKTVVVLPNKDVRDIYRRNAYLAMLARMRTSGDLAVEEHTQQRAAIDEVFEMVQSVIPDAPKAVGTAPPSAAASATSWMQLESLLKASYQTGEKECDDHYADLCERHSSNKEYVQQWSMIELERSQGSVKRVYDRIHARQQLQFKFHTAQAERYLYRYKDFLKQRKVLEGKRREKPRSFNKARLSTGEVIGSTRRRTRSDDKNTPQEENPFLKEVSDRLQDPSLYFDKSAPTPLMTGLLHPATTGVRLLEIEPRLVDPVQVYMEDRQRHSYWTKQQIETLLECFNHRSKYMEQIQHPKYFWNIAKLIPGKTTTEVVDFYYSFKHYLRLKEKMVPLKTRGHKKSPHRIKDNPPQHIIKRLAVSEDENTFLYGTRLIVELLDQYDIQLPRDRD